jgi:hypothetical protein
MKPYIGLPELVNTQRFIQHVADAVERQGKPEGYGVGRLLQSGKVLLEEKYLPLIGAHGLIDPVAVKKPMVKDRNLSLFASDKMTIKINEHGEKVSLLRLRVKQEAFKPLVSTLLEGGSENIISLW